eukprot:COSAG02_NODE_35723_length_464_cov_1.090411_1_plen_91_part_01
MVGARRLTPVSFVTRCIALDAHGIHDVRPSSDTRAHDNFRTHARSNTIQARQNRGSARTAVVGHPRAVVLYHNVAVSLVNGNQADPAPKDG